MNALNIKAANYSLFLLSCFYTTLYKYSGMCPVTPLSLVKKAVIDS